MSFRYGSRQPNNNRARSRSPQGLVDPEQILRNTIDEQQRVYLEQRRRADEIASKRLRQKADDLEYETKINTMIDQINGKEIFGIPFVELDYYDPQTRYVIGAVVRTHGMTTKSLDLLLNSQVLLGILKDRIGRSRIGRVLCAAGSTAAECARLSRDYLSSASAAFGFSRAVKRPARSPSPPRELVVPLEPYPNRAPEQPAPGHLRGRRHLRGDRPYASGMQLAPPDAVDRQVNLDALLARHLSPNAYAAPAPAAVSRQSAADAVARQSAADALLARQLSTNAPLQINALRAFESAQNAAPASAAPFSAPAPAPAPDEEKPTCAICFTGPGIDDNGINRGPLGYVETHSNGAIGHPDRFHQSCLLACPGNICPMCRAPGPVWGLERPPGQGGGGSSKKYRSKSKSKSKTKIRRLRKSRNKSRSKPRKSRKSRKPRSSSRRK
jgi:hypothetical protein